MGVGVNQGVALKAGKKKPTEGKGVEGILQDWLGGRGTKKVNGEKMGPDLYWVKLVPKGSLVSC